MKKAGGAIDIYSEPGLGTSVSVLLPATCEDAMPSAGAAPRGESQDGHGETILLVEDEESLRELTRRILTRHGYQAVSYTHLDVYKRQMHRCRFHLISA